MRLPSPSISTVPYHAARRTPHAAWGGAHLGLKHASEQYGRVHAGTVYRDTWRWQLGAPPSSARWAQRGEKEGAART